MQLSGGRAFQAAGTACAKALGWYHAWHVGRKIEKLKGDQGVILKDFVGQCERIGLCFIIESKPFEKESNIILRGFF